LGGVRAAAEAAVYRLITELGLLAQELSITLRKKLKNLKNLLTTVHFSCY
jgi:hypothetical protein